MLADELCVRVRARTHVKSHMQKGLCNRIVWKLILQPRQMCTGVLSEETGQRAPTPRSAAMQCQCCIVWIRAQTSEFFPGLFLHMLVTPPPWPSGLPRPSQLSLSLHLCLSCDFLGGGRVCVLRATAVQPLVTAWCAWLKSIPGS